MSQLLLAAAALLFLAGTAFAADQNSSLVDESWCGKQTMCGLHDDDGPWMSTLQQWALSAPEHGDRQGRIMALPPAQGYYVTDRVDGPLLAPPPPPHPGKQHNQPQWPPPPGARPHADWQHAPPSSSKIVNRPPNPYQDKFKPSPSYPAPVHSQPIPVHSHAVDRVDENRQPPQKQVSETDLYLLGAIEKLVWRADLFEKRLRKLEENVHLMVTGVDNEKEPCADNFTRVGGGCYHVSADAANWKGASYACRRLNSYMLEIDSDQEKDQLTASIFSDKKHKGGEFWTGGLNPGLLWIWAHSARPVAHHASSTPPGAGRCLAWGSDPARSDPARSDPARSDPARSDPARSDPARSDPARSDPARSDPARSVPAPTYRGQDCALRHRYICEREEDKTILSNEIERVARKIREGRKPKILWTDDEP